MEGNRKGGRREECMKARIRTSRETRNGMKEGQRKGNEKRKERAEKQRNELIQERRMKEGRKSRKARN